MSTASTTTSITAPGREILVTHQDEKITEIAVRATNGSGIVVWPNLDLADVRRIVQSLATEATATHKGTSTALKAPAPKAKTPKAPSARASAPDLHTEPADGEGRAYRRLTPELQEEVIALWGQVGSVAAIAETLKVPRHTVTGWVRRLKNEGLIAKAT